MALWPPLTPLSNEINSLFNTKIPRKIISKNTTTHILVYSFYVNYTNEHLRARESFKTIKRGLRNITPELKMRDDAIIEEYDKINELIKEISSLCNFKFEKFK